MKQRTEFLPRAPRARVCAIRQAAERLAIERRYLGITNELVRAVAKRDSTDVGTVLSKMTREGKLHGVSIEGHLRHWFISAEVAQQWAAATQPIRKETKPRPAVIQRRAAAPAPVSIAPRQERGGEPIITERTKITRDVRQWPTARWQMRQEAPDERWPSFAASRPGIDPTTGQPWEAAA